MKTCVTEPRIAGASDPLTVFASRPMLVLLALTLVALAARAVQFGNPVIQIDDQFYLLVGDRMWHGALPYVDIWDRKPIGLFLIYWAIRALPGDGVIASQLVATAFAIATAFVIWRIARRIADPRGALAAAIVYLLFLGMFGGDGGQSPVFYNLFVALAALCVIRAIERASFDTAASGWVALATTLMGVAMQVKYTAMFEGAYFGLAMMWRMQRQGLGAPRILFNAAIWLLLALLPTALGWLAYWSIGQGGAFAYANFASIFLREREGAMIVLGRLLGTIGKLVPLLIAVALAGRPPPSLGQGYQADGPAEWRFIIGWAVAAVLGYLVFGSYFDHYTLPLLVPLSICAAPAFGRDGAVLAILWRSRRYAVPFAAFVMLFGIGITIGTIDRNRRVRGHGVAIDQMAAFIRPRLTNCLFVYDGEPALYRLTGSCLPTRWVFPDHLNSKREKDAVGVDTLAETQRIMAGRPSIVVSAERPETKMNWATWNFMEAVLKRDYVPLREWRIGNGFRVVYGRKPGT